MKHLSLTSLVLAAVVGLPAVHTASAATVSVLPVSSKMALVKDLAPANWSQWAKWVEAKVHISSNGHGPDIGSNEWARAVDRKLKISSNGHGPTIRSKEWRRAVEAKLLKKPVPPKAPVIPKDWSQWAKWVETKVRISSNGHGPDIGSDEWANAVDRKLKISVDGHGPDLKSGEWRRAVEFKLGYK
jgi:hypothetical protein